MISLKAMPQSELLEPFIDCYWFLEQSKHDSAKSAQPKLIANPAMHLIFCSEDQPYHYTQASKKVTEFGPHLLHPSSKSTQIQQQQQFSLIGIKFKPGASFALTSLLPSVELNKVQDFCVSEFNQQLYAYLKEDCICSESLAILLDRLLYPFCLQAQRNKAYLMSKQCLQLLDSGKTIKQLSDFFDCSLRTLERSFVKVIGLTLQQYQTMQRLEALIVYLYQHKDKKINWVEVAADFDFSDQPHLIRYLKQQIGLSPNSYLNQRDLTIDAYGDFSD